MAHDRKKFWAARFSARWWVWDAWGTEARQWMDSTGVSCHFFQLKCIAFLLFFYGPCQKLYVPCVILRIASWIGTPIISISQVVKGRFTLRAHGSQLSDPHRGPSGRKKWWGEIQGKKLHDFDPSLPSISCPLPLLFLPPSSPLLEGVCRERFMNKEKLSSPLINFMGHVDMYKSDINMMSKARVL